MSICLKIDLEGGWLDVRGSLKSQNNRKYILKGEDQ